MTSLKNLGQKGQLLPLPSVFAFIPYLVGENSSSSTAVNYFNKEDELQKEPPSKREREKNKNKTLDLNLNWTCDYRERRRWLYFFNWKHNPLWLEARSNTRPYRTLLRPPRLAGEDSPASSLRTNGLRQTVVWEHKWGWGVPYIKSYGTVHLPQVSYSTHLLNFNDQSYD